MATRRKRIYARVKLPATDELIATWEDFDFRGFTKELNAGAGECVLTLGRAFDYDGNDILEGNDVEIVIADRDTTGSGNTDGDGVKRIYRGYISFVERMDDANRQNIVVHILGYYTRLALDILKNSAQTTLYSHNTAGLTVTLADQVSADIGLMMRTVIDRYQTESGDTTIFYTADSIPDTGTTATYKFDQKTYREAIDDLKGLAPSGTYWYVDETGLISFKTIPTSATHVFVFGKDFTKIRVQKSIETVRNFVLIWDGKTASYVYKHYQDSASIAKYGRRAATISNFGIDNSDAADLLGAKFLAENKDPQVKVIVSILDNNGIAGKGYDIESINPGDTCKFVGYSSTQSDVFNDNMLITKISYGLDAVEIELSIQKTGIVDFQTQQNRKIADINSGGLSIPESYT